MFSTTVRILTIIVVLLGFSSCGTTLSLVHYNVGVFDKFEDNSIEMVADAVRQMSADVVALNEVDSCTVRTGKVDQIARFAGIMGEWTYHYASAMPFNEGAYGVGLVASPELKVLKTSKVALPKADGYEPRVMAVVEYESYIVATVHLDLTPDSRLAQVSVINEHMNELCRNTTKPVFLTGDFNARPDSELIDLIRETWTLISPTACTYPSDSPDRCIDYIFVRPQGHRVELRSNRNRSCDVDLSVASDHLPVQVTVRIK